MLLRYLFGFEFLKVLFINYCCDFININMFLFLRNVDILYFNFLKKIISLNFFKSWNFFWCILRIDIFCFIV